MINYKLILAGEVRKRKYFRRMAKKYRNRWRCCEEELRLLRRRICSLESHNSDLERNMEWRIEQRAKSVIAAEKFAIEYDYCQQIDVLKAKLAVYETAKEPGSFATGFMTITQEQCNRLERELNRLHDIERKYKDVSKKLKDVRTILNK